MSKVHQQFPKVLDFIRVILKRMLFSSI